MYKITYKITYKISEWRPAKEPKDSGIASSNSFGSGNRA